jgi:hypothetical protein
VGGGAPKLIGRISTSPDETKRRGKYTTRRQGELLRFTELIGADHFYGNVEAAVLALTPSK